MQAKELFNMLPGKWQYSRKVTNHKDPSLSGEGHGKCEFVSVDEYDLLYAETGTFNTENGHPLKTFNSYFYVFNANTSTLEKHFVNDTNTKGKLFYILSEDKTASHLCGQDTYKASYEVSKPSEFIITYSVAGPRKDYVLRTLFTKI